MTRPSRSLDQKLVATARAMLPHTGLSGLSLREVARKSGVNLGMFHYYFKSKDAFTRRVLQETYEHFFITFNEASQVPGDPLQKLRSVLVAFARFARDNKDFYALLARELLNEQPECQKFVKDNFPRHAGILIALLQEGKNKKLIQDLPIPVLAAFAMGSMGVPNIIVAALERNKVKTIAGFPLKGMTDDKTIEARADMVIRGLSCS